jgi:predicted component of type VI protein secretion system
MALILRPSPRALRPALTFRGPADARKSGGAENKPIEIQLINLSTHQLINLSTYQLINSSTHQLINPSTHQLINPSTYQLINLSTYQLINTSPHHHISEQKKERPFTASPVVST